MRYVRVSCTLNIYSDINLVDASVSAAVMISINSAYFGFRKADSLQLVCFRALAELYRLDQTILAKVSCGELIAQEERIR